MGDIIQFKKKESKKEETRAPKVYANLDEYWQALISEENIDVFPDPLRQREKLIFILGVIADQRQQRGEWFTDDEQTEKFLKAKGKEKEVGNK